MQPATLEQMIEAKDPLCDYVLINLPPEDWTRQHYLDLAYAFDPPEEWSAELEAELPAFFQNWDRVTAEEAEEE